MYIHSDKKDCAQHDTCGAPICPLDKQSLECGLWYPNEEICRSQKNRLGISWIKNQRKIARKTKYTDKYFTLSMLKRNCVIGAGIKGIDPNREKENQIKIWLKNHLEKRKLSKEEREKIAQRFAQARGRRN